jgi:mono/diheme cytochrome c family protein
VIVCERCGTENVAFAQRCIKCHGSLGDAPAGATPAAPQSTSSSPEVAVEGIVVALMGLGGVVAAGWWLVNLMSDVRDASREISAVQVTQVYTQAGFWVLAAIAFLLAGILFVVSTR